MKIEAINIAEKFNLFSDQWSPRIIAQMNNYQFKIAKIQGEFIWHSHPDTDETFIVIEGEMQILLRDGSVDLKAGEMLVVPKGVEHKPVAEQECKILMVEITGTVNTGDAGGKRTQQDPPWV